MTLAADRLLRLDVAGPASRVMTLASTCIDLQNVCSRLAGRDFHRLVTFVTRRRFQVRTVPEVVKTERRSKRYTVLHRVRLARVTGSACGELIVRLVRVTGIAFEMPGHAGLQALFVKPMAENASCGTLGHLVGIHLPFHLFRVVVIAMREAFEPELCELLRKRDPRALGVNRELMADDAQLAFPIRHIFLVAVQASRVSRK